jgi:hypothetical protein
MSAAQVLKDAFAECASSNSDDAFSSVRTTSATTRLNDASASRRARGLVAGIFSGPATSPTGAAAAQSASVVTGAAAAAAADDDDDEDEDGDDDEDIADDDGDADEDAADAVSASTSSALDDISASSSASYASNSSSQRVVPLHLFNSAEAHECVDSDSVAEPNSAQLAASKSFRGVPVRARAALSAACPNVPKPVRLRKKVGGATIVDDSA